MLGAAAAALLVLTSGPVHAEEGGLFAGLTDAQRSKLDAAEQSFQQSETLKLLRERSEANRAKNKKAIENKYCYRQAELGIGDCGGLSLIPGMTNNGKQKTPEWLSKLLGVEQQEQCVQELIASDPSQLSTQFAAAVAGGGAPTHLSMRVVEAPAELCAPMRTDKRISPPFRVRVKAHHAGALEFPFTVKAYIVDREAANSIH
ncbi:hypothetical protein MNEG_12404, partial [Monoraphidium neglectum]